MCKFLKLKNKQGVALTGRNRTGPPCSVGRPTADAPGPAAADRRRARRPARPPAGSVTDDDRRRLQTTDVSEQNNTDRLGGPVIIQEKSNTVKRGDTTNLIRIILMVCRFIWQSYQTKPIFHHTSPPFTTSISIQYQYHSFAIHHAPVSVDCLRATGDREALRLETSSWHSHWQLAEQRSLRRGRGLDRDRLRRRFPSANSRSASDRRPISIDAPATSFSTVSQMTSPTSSLASICSRCWSTDRNVVSCGVSITCQTIASSEL